MDRQNVWTTFRQTLARFWQWLKPHLSRFHAKRKRIWKQYHIHKIFCLLVLIAILIMSIYLFYISKTTKVDELESGLKEATIIYDENGSEAGRLSAQKGSYVPLDEISPHIVDAVISTEDRKFYQHHGFDLKGIARAGARMVVNRSTAGGGGSTITQQLAKNAYLTLDQTFTRKAKELFLALEIEKRYSKDEILTMYLNMSYFGNGVWGVQDASHKYFGVNANQLTVGEAATLAGMLKGPSLYNPIDHLDNATNRRDTVLSVMVENGKVTQEVAQEQQAVPLGDLLMDTYDPADAGYQYPHYFDEVIKEAQRHGIAQDDIMKRGYKIYTTLNQNYQQQLQATYQENSYFPQNAADGTMVQSASVALNPVTGGVQALVGRRGEHTFLGYSFATDMRRSPGSTIKPLSVYAPALEAGYRPDSLLKDEPQSYYESKNYDGTHAGEVKMYESLAHSLNLPAIWLLHEIGLDKGYNKTEEFGLKLAESDKYWGLALGGLEQGTSPMTMAGAYAPFANGGLYYTPHLITKIVDSTGAVVVDNTQAKSRRIISQKTADEMTSMMLGTFSNGTAYNARPDNYTMAGKTGTTETNFDLTKVNDQWIVGYTPDLVIATWMGFEQTSEKHYLSGTSGQVIGPLFRAMSNNILPYTQGSDFRVADAYATGGKVMAPEEVQTTDSSTDSAWRQDVSDFTDQAKEGVLNFGEKVIDETKNLLGGLWNSWQGQ